MKYDLDYLEKMWNTVVLYYELKTYNPNDGAYIQNKYPLWHDVLEQINSQREKLGKKEIATARKEAAKKGKYNLDISESEENTQIDYYAFNKEIELYDKDISILKKYIPHQIIPYILKSFSGEIPYNELKQYYKQLRNSAHRNLIENTILSSTTYVPEKEKFGAKHIQITLDAFDIKQAEVDNKIGEYKISKLLSKNKLTQNVNINTLEQCANAINSILNERYENVNIEDSILKENYEDSKISEIEFEYIFNDKESPVPHSFSFYKKHPITVDDLAYGRIEYMKDDKYQKYSHDWWLAKSYKDLNLLERKMIYNVIYELYYIEWQMRVKQEYRKFVESIPNYDIANIDFSSPLSPNKSIFKIKLNQLLNDTPDTSK